MKKLLISLMLIGIPLFALPAGVGAVDVFNKDVCERPEAAQSTVCKDKEIDKGGKQQNPIIGNDGILTTIINLLTVIVAIVSVIMIILAGLKLVTSGTNPQDVSNARERILYAVIALAVAALAQALVRFIVAKLNS